MHTNDRLFNPRLAAPVPPGPAPRPTTMPPTPADPIGLARALVMSLRGVPDDVTARVRAELEPCGLLGDARIAELEDERDDLNLRIARLESDHEEYDMNDYKLRDIIRRWEDAWCGMPDIGELPEEAREPLAETYAAMHKASDIPTP